jgi:SAM-dependent methyltransferase
MKPRSPRRDLVLADLRRRLGGVSGVVLDLGGSRDERHHAAYAPANLRGRWIVANFDPTTRPDVVADAHRLPLRDATVDVAVLAEIVEHLARPEEAAAEVFRVLRPGGTLVATVPFAYRVHGDPDDYQRLTPSGLRRLFAAFTIEAIETQGGPWTVLSQVVRDAMLGARPRFLPSFAARAVVAAARRMSRWDSSPRVRSAEMLRGWTTGYLVVARKPPAT